MEHTVLGLFEWIAFSEYTQIKYVIRQGHLTHLLIYDMIGSSSELLQLWHGIEWG